MGKTRVCGATCHTAKGGTCRYWCGGVFHGAAGQVAREAFAREFLVDRLPTTERAFQELTAQGELFADVSHGDRWRTAIRKAVEARGGVSVAF